MVEGEREKTKEAKDSEKQAFFETYMDNRMGQIVTWEDYKKAENKLFKQGREKGGRK